MSTAFRFFAILIALSVVSVTDFPLVSIAHGQTAPALFESAGPAQATHLRAKIAPRRARRARVRLAALDAPAVTFNLFDGTDLVIRKVKADRPRPGRLVWHGRSDDGAIATVTVVNGAMTATVFREFETFEAVGNGDGTYTVREIEPAAYPTDDPEMDAPQDLAGAATGQTGVAAIAADGVTEIDVMVVWTPAARNAVGGTHDAIESLVLNSVANANLSYMNSLVNARLRLVYSAEVAYTETPSSISTDLAYIASPNDGRSDQVHTLRNQYGADIVTLIGAGYAGNGACGVGYRMTTPTTSFANSAFNVVDYSCAAGYLSYTHEVGHNQGLHHDPANATGSAPIYSYAYGYQDPAGAFRTVLSYGGATRIPYLSNPQVSYNGRVTGTATQDNARALNNTASVVSAFRPTAGTPPCTYSVSPTSMAFSESMGSATVSVTTSAGCTWSTTSGAAWASVSSGGSGSGTVTVAVTTNTSAARSTSMTVAGQTVTVTQAAAPVCSYSVTPTSLSFGPTSTTATVSVSTTAACAWSSNSGSSWASVSGGGTGSGTATVAVTTNTAAARTASMTVAGQTVTLTQAAAPVCTYSVTPTSLSFGATSATATVSVSTTAACSWSSNSGSSWASVSGGGTGSGSASVTVSTNSTGSRVASVNVAGQTVAVSQAAAPPTCTYAVSPTSWSVSANSGTAVLTVTTQSGCAWSSSSSTSWASVSGAGTGAGTATVAVAANIGASRSASLVVAGRTVSVSQAGAPKGKGNGRK